MNSNFKDDPGILELWLKGKDIVKVLIGKKWVILSVFLMGAVFGGLKAFFFNGVLFTGRVTFSIIEKGSPNSGLSSLVSQFGGGLGGDGTLFSPDNILILLKSNKIIEQSLLSKASGFQDSVFLDVYLVRQFHKDINNGEINLKSFRVPRQDFSREADSIFSIVVKEVKESIIIERGEKKSTINELKVVSNNETWAQNFSLELIENASNMYLEIKTGKSKRNLIVLQNRLDSVYIELNAAMYGVASEVDQSIGFFQAQPRVSRLKKEMQVQLLSNLYGELVKNIELNKFTLSQEEPVFQIIDASRMPLEKKGKGLIKNSIVFAFLFSSLVISYHAIRTYLNI
jgi:hypothetical protein